jgi:putative transcriptional regulator
MDNETTARIIKDLRARTGLSAQKFGDRYKIPMRTVQNWEYGRRGVPEYVLFLLERAVLEDFPEEKK